MLMRLLWGVRTNWKTNCGGILADGDFFFFLFSLWRPGHVVFLGGFEKNNIHFDKTAKVMRSSAYMSLQAHTQHHPILGSKL